MLEGFGLALLQGDADDTEYLVAGANREVETARLGRARVLAPARLLLVKVQVATARS